MTYAGDLDLVSAAHVIRVFPHQPMSAVLGFWGDQKVDFFSRGDAALSGALPP